MVTYSLDSSRWFRLLVPVADDFSGLPAFEDHVKGRDEEEGQDRRGDEAAYDHHRERLGEEGSFAGDPDRHRRGGEDGGRGGHQDRTQPVTSAFQYGFPGAHTLLAVLADQVEQDDGVGHHDTHEHQRTEERGYAERGAGYEQEPYGTAGREGNGNEEQERLQQAAERRHHDEVDEQHGDRQREAEVREALLLALRYAAERDGRAVRQVERVYLALQVGAHFSHVLLGGGGADRGGALAVYAGDLGRPFHLLDVGDVAQRNDPGGGRYREGPDLPAPPCGLPDLEDHVAILPADLDLRDGLALVDLCRSLRHMGCREAVRERLFRVDPHPDLRRRVAEVARHVGGPVHAFHDVDEPVVDLSQFDRVGGLHVGFEVGVERRARPRGEDNRTRVAEGVEAVAELTLHLALIRVGIGRYRVGCGVRPRGGSRGVLSGSRGDLVGAYRGHVGEHALDRPGGFSRRFQARARGKLLADGEAVLLGLFEEVGLEQRGQGERADQDNRRPNEGDRPVAYRPTDDGHVGTLKKAVPLQFVLALLRRALRSFHEPVSQDGDDGKRHDQRCEQRGRNGDGERTEELAGRPTDKGDGQEDGHGREGRGGDGAGYLTGRGHYRGRLLFTVAEVAVDVFEDHDGVVHHPAHRDGKTAEGQEVEGKVAGPESDEGYDDRERYGHGRNDRRADREQEQQHDEHGEPGPHQPLDRQTLYGTLDKRCLIEDRPDLGPTTEVVLEAGDPVRHRFGDGDGVAFRRLGDANPQRRFAVGPGERAGRRERALDRGYVTQPHRLPLHGSGGYPRGGRRRSRRGRPRPCPRRVNSRRGRRGSCGVRLIAVAHDQVRDISDGRKLVADLDREGLSFFGVRPGGEGHVVGL